MQFSNNLQVTNNTVKTKARFYNETHSERLERHKTIKMSRKQARKNKALKMAIGG